MNTTSTLPLRSLQAPAVGVALCLLLGACASAPPAENLPAPLAPAPDESWVMTVAARGVQIYECRAGASGAAWTFVAPEAELFDDMHHPVGSHGAGPSWQASDGSRVVGTLKARVDAPSADAIPWLLMSAQDAGPPGRFSGVTSVRRIHTVGGTAPKSGCSADSIGARTRVPYTADYLFHTTAGTAAMQGAAK
jgi:hypothetical protein